MKYSPQIYARALADLAAEKHSAAEEKKISANFIALVRKNGDSHALPRIVSEAKKYFRISTGKKLLVVESARPLPSAMRRQAEAVVPDADEVQEKINPELIAGVRLTVNQDFQFDASLQHKINKLFTQA